MARYSIEIRKRKYIKGYSFLSSARNLSDKYVKKKLLDTATKTELDAVKTPSKKVVHKAAEATEEVIGSKISDKTVKLKHIPDENSRNIKKIAIPSEKREEILNKLRQAL